MGKSGESGNKNVKAREQRKIEKEKKLKEKKRKLQEEKRKKRANKKDPNPCKKLLKELGNIAGKNANLKYKVDLKRPQDLCMGWFGSSIHPLQYLETIHHQHSQEEILSLVSEKAKEAEEKKKKKIEEVLNHYFTITPIKPSEIAITEKDKLNKFNDGKENVFEKLQSASSIMNSLADKLYDRQLRIGEEKDKAWEIAKETGEEFNEDDIEEDIKDKENEELAKKAFEACFKICKEIFNSFDLKDQNDCGIPMIEMAYDELKQHKNKYQRDVKQDPIAIMRKKDESSEDYGERVGKIEDRRKDIKPEVLKWKAIKTLCLFRIPEVLKQLQTACDGLTQVQMLHFIDEFYLFRLLVPYTIISDKREGVDRADKRAASSQLTKILNGVEKNKKRWVRDWVRKWIINIANALQKEIEHPNERFFFHLKGGRALYYLLGEPDKGDSDWDTAIIINPHLSAKDWYDVFRQVHNVILNQLIAAKLDFFKEIHKYRDDFKDYFNFVEKEHEKKPRKKREQNQEIEQPEQEDLYVEEFGSGCKAELIDIAIPRRDTVECREQWNMMGPASIIRINELNWTDNVPIPPHIYFINEYIVMVREALAGVSPHPDKAHKRVKRLCELMRLSKGESAKQLKESINNEYKIVQNLPGQVSDLVGGDNADQLCGKVIISQFYKSLELRDDPNFAGAFWKKLKSDYDSITSDQLTKTEKKLGGDGNLAQEDKDVLKWLFLSQKVSGWAANKRSGVEKHIRDRQNKFEFKRSLEPKDFQKKWDKLKKSSSSSGVGKNIEKYEEKKVPRRLRLSRFIRSIYNAFVGFDPSSNRYALGDPVGFEDEVRIAVTGSLAAFIYADGARIGKENMEKLDPIRAIDLKVFCFTKNVELPAVSQVLLKPILERYSKQEKSIKFPELNEQKVEELGWYKEDWFDKKPLPPYVFTWPETLDYGEFGSYAPLAVRISFEKPGIWPFISVVDGFPVVSLKDLVREYEQKAAAATEFGRRRVLRETSDVLKLTLTRYDFVYEGIELLKKHDGN